MVLASDVHDRSGRLVLGAGVVLGDKHVRALKMYGVTTVEIESEDEDQQGSAAAAVDPAVAEAVRARLMHAFQLNVSHTNHPLITELVEYAYAKLMAEGGPTQPEPATDQQAAPVSLPKETPSIEYLARRAAGIASPPAIYSRLMEVINHPFSSADDIGQVIGEDPAMTAKLLRIANSSLYAFPRQIETVTRAVTIIGTAQLSDLALSMSATKLFNEIPADLVDVTSFWQHSVSSAVVARGLASLLRQHNVERFFIGGLLHDVGRAVMLVYCPAHAREAIMRARQSGRPLYETEREVLGYDHADLGFAMLEAWGLPEAHCSIVGRHHNPSASMKFPMEAAVAYTADLVANALQMGSSGEQLVPPLQPRAWETLGLDAEVLPQLFADAERQVADTVAILSKE